MLPTFVITLREGVEASLIVGILAAFLVKQDRAGLLRWMWIGVGVAAALCLTFGITLELVNENLPQKQQEMLETVVGVIAVAFVTYMIVWMRRHARELKRSIEQHAGEAVAAGSGAALVFMAFLAVFREGFETAVFLVAQFQGNDTTTASIIGALLGLVVAVILGGALYKGGARINLARFFRITGALLVIVAAGLVATAFHTGHEAGWITFMQAGTFDMSWLVEPGTVRYALLSGLFGLQPNPVVIEVIAYLAYLVPVMTYVLWPQSTKKPAPTRKSETPAAVSTPVTVS